MVSAPGKGDCPECGVPLPEYWPRGFCPKCTLDGALGIDAEISDALHESQRRFGDFELIEEIGRGGMGVIYRARQTSLNRIVALKMILAGQFASKEEVLRFRGEAEAAANLQHPNIVRIHEMGERDGHHFFSMDFVEGRTLSEILRDGPLPAQRAAKYACRIAEAIEYAHTKGVLHRDLKPSNVVIDANDEPRITDFGLAKRMRSDFGVTVTGQLLGSPNFMPPEQTSAKNAQARPSSDVYGVGAILYCLLTGRPPFHAETIEGLLLLLRDADPVSPRLLNPSVPRDLETICMKCLEKDPARRYATAQKLTDELKRFIRDEPIEARPVHATAKFWRWCRRRPAIAALSAAVLGLLIAVAVSSSISAWRVSIARASEQRANRDLRNTVDRLELQRVENLFSIGESGTAVAQLATLLRSDPSNHIAATRLVSALVHRDWALCTGVTMQHSDRVDTLRFSPNGRTILSVGRDQSARVWNAESGKLISVLKHKARVLSAQYDSSGKQIITASEDASAQIWNAETGEPGSCLEHSGKVYWAEFSSDGRQVVTACADGTARLWDAATGQVKRELRKHTSHVVLARFSRDNKLVVTAGSHGSIRVWDANSGEMLWRVEDRSSPLVGMDLSSDGKHLLIVCLDEVIRLWNLETRAEIPLVGENRAVVHGAFSPNSQFLITSSHDNTARFWDANTGFPIGSPLKHDGTVEWASFSRDGGKIVTLSRDHSARIWDTQTRQHLCQPIYDAEKFRRADFSPDGLRLATAGKDGIIHVWDLQPRRFTGLSSQFPAAITTIDFSSDGNSLLVTSFDGTARVFDARTLTLLAALPHETGLYLAKFNGDGNQVFSVCGDAVRIWDWRRRTVVAGPFKHAGKIISIDFNRDANQVVTAGSDGTARVWNAATWQPITPPLLHTGLVTMARFSPDGSLVVTASEDHTARVWNATTGKAVTPPLMHNDHVRSAVFSPDGKRIATASTDDTSCLWDARTGERTVPPLQHTRLVERASFSPDGMRIITGSLDYTARIWDGQTGGALTPPLKHRYSLLGVSFTSDGESVMTTCWNGTTRMWNASSGLPLTESLEQGDWIWRSFAFDALNRRVAVGGRDSRVHLWNFSQIPIPVPDWYLDFAEAVAGIRLRARGSLEFISATEFETAIRELESKRKDEFYARLARWFVTTPSQREVAPF